MTETTNSDAQQQPDFTILLQKIRESEDRLPELMAEVRIVTAEAEEIRELRQVFDQVSSEPPRTLTLS